MIATWHCPACGAVARLAEESGTLNCSVCTCQVRLVRSSVPTNDPLRGTDRDPDVPTPLPDVTADLLPGLSPASGGTLLQGVPPRHDPVPVAVPGYEILGVLGRGGMGVVYKARHLALKRTVALKMILVGGHAGPEELLRFRIEAEAVARLQHPNIVQIHEVGASDGHPYCALEFVEGGNLAGKIKGTPLPPRDAARVVAALARAMHLAHSRNVVHRDLKPANVLLAADGTPKITDFGLARQLDSDSGETRDGAILGTPSYMAPEQAAGFSHAAGPAADIYALGAILYECLAGRPPFLGQTLVETLDQVRTQEPVPPSRWRHRLPLDLEVICLKCLRKEPENRYASAADLADELGRFLRGEPIRARPVGRVARLLLWARRRPAPAAVCVLAVLVVVLGGLGGGAAWLWQRAEQAGRALADARDQTEKARLGEAAANEKLTTANDRLEQVLYLRRISLAHGDWRENNLAGMDSELLACPPQRRHWEWYYLDHLCHGELRAFRFPTDGIGMTLSADGGRLAGTDPGGLVRIWDVATGKELLTLPAAASPLRCLCLSPDGHLLATDSGSDTLNIWDTRTGQLLRQFKQESRVDAVAFSPDEQNPSFR